jgi:hypothetical protein
MTIGMLGGIMGPMTAADALVAALKSGSNPFSFIIGMRKEPMAEQSATADPETPAKNMLVTILTWASPPFNRPTIISANPINLSVILAAFIKSPAKIKNGMAMNGKTSTPVNMRCAMIPREMPLAKDRKTSEDTPKQKAIGTPDIKQKKKTAAAVSISISPI